MYEAAYDMCKQILEKDAESDWSCKQHSEYDWWHAEGKQKLVMIDTKTPRSIAMVNQWHEYFLWQPIEENVHQTKMFGKSTNERAKTWLASQYYAVFFENGSGLFAGWTQGAEQLSNVGVGDSCTILYEREMDTQFLKELGTLQTACEMQVNNLYWEYVGLHSANEKMNSLLPFGKAEARRQWVKKTETIRELREQIELILSRVNEIRAIVLG